MSWMMAFATDSAVALLRPLDAGSGSRNSVDPGSLFSRLLMPWILLVNLETTAAFPPRRTPRALDEDMPSRIFPDNI